MYGRRPNNAVDYSTDPNTDLPLDTNAWSKYRDELVSLIFPAISKRAARQQDKYRQKLDQSRRRLVHEFMKEGTLVMIKDPKYVHANKHSKPGHEPTYIGPYIIVKANKHGTYTVKDGLGNITNRNIPLDQLKVVPPVDANDSIDAPRADAAERSDEWEVEKILNHRETDGGQLEYHVQWKGYPKLKDTTWENEHQFVDTSVIERYFRESSANSGSQRKARTHALHIDVNNQFCFALSGPAFLDQ
jgi:hypothetical protein